VGQKVQAIKRVAHPLHCVWCDQIQVGKTWMPERRESQKGLYLDDVCPACQPEYFQDSLYPRA